MRGRARLSGEARGRSRCLVADICDYAWYCGIPRRRAFLFVVVRGSSRSPFVAYLQLPVVHLGRPQYSLSIAAVGSSARPCAVAVVCGYVQSCAVARGRPCFSRYLVVLCGRSLRPWISPVVRSCSLSSAAARCGARSFAAVRSRSLLSVAFRGCARSFAAAHCLSLIHI